MKRTTLCPAALLGVAATLACLPAQEPAAADAAPTGAAPAAGLGGRDGSVDDPELQDLEDDYARELIAVRRELGEQYLAALKRLQGTLTSSGQIEQALLVKLERERVEDLLDTAPELELPTAGVKPLAAVELDIARARCSGGPVYDPKHQRIRNWTAAGAQAEWDLDAEMPAGRYEVIVGYAAGDDAGGDFELVAGVSDPVRKSVDTNAQSSWKSVSNMLAGTIPINEDTRSLALTCVSLRQPYLWTVHSVTLAPPGTWEEMERERLAAALEGSGNNPQPNRKLGELETLRGARLDPSKAPGRADRFTILFEGESLPVRLYGVTAPPASDAVRGELYAFRRFLPKKADENNEKLEGVGRLALEHVRRRLAGATFNVYTYREPDPSSKGRVFAFVVADGKTLGQSLVERGLAIAERRSAPLPDGTAGQVYIERLRIAEEEARVRRLALWDLQPANPK